jgi:type I restriction enzyme R subunit
MKPEDRARQKIDDLLEQAGWVVQDRDRMNLDAALGVAVREFPLPSGAADYLLFINFEPVGIVEAKKIGHALIGVEEQSAKYLTNLPETLSTQRSTLPFSYESNSVETRFTNHLDPEPRSRPCNASTPCSAASRNLIPLWRSHRCLM